MDLFSHQLANEQLNSEEDVRAKIVLPLLQKLEYPSEFISTEVPVYYNEGRERKPPKHADVICYTKRTSKPDRAISFGNEYRDSTLVVVEVKAPGISLDDAQAQAEFYVNWTRAPLFLITNGVEFSFFSHVGTAADKRTDYQSISEMIGSLAEISARFGFQAACDLKNSAISNRDQTISLFSSYCESLANRRLNDIEIAQSYRFVRNRPAEEQDLGSIIASKRSFAIVGSPGIGKTYASKRVAKIMAESFRSSGCGLVPVIIHARYWGRQFSSIADAIVFELRRSIPDITASLVTKLIDGLCVIFDGLDEVTTDKDLLLDELISFTTSQNALFICTSRLPEDAKRLGLEALSIELLNDEQMIRYLGETGVINPARIIRSISASGRDLLRLPLHLVMFADYLLHHGLDDVPRNMSDLYQETVHHMLMGSADYLGGVDESEVLLAVGHYALENLVDSGCESLHGFLAKNYQQSTDVIERSAKDSGLIVLVGGVHQFSHHTMQEYLSAYYIAHQSQERLIQYLETLSPLEGFENVFILLCGCLASPEKQRVCLDHLEEYNFPLFLKCLKGRYRFSQDDNHLDREQLETILSQALRTYVHISDKFLKNAKKHLPFWQGLSTPDAKINLAATFNIQTTGLSFELIESLPAEGEVQLEIIENDNTAALETESGHRVPVFSLTRSDLPGYHYYQLDLMFGGVDCAREIAIDMIQSDLKMLLDSCATLLEEPLPMRIGLLDNTLSMMRLTFEKEGGGIVRANLRNCSINDICALIAGKEDLAVRVGNANLSYELVCLLIGLTVAADNHYLDYVMPDYDSLDAEHHWIWEMYKPETISSWVSTCVIQTYLSYRQWVETFIPDLSPLLPKYAMGPLCFTVRISPGSGEGYLSCPNVDIVPSPVSDFDHSCVEVQWADTALASDSDSFNKRNERFINRSHMHGRNGAHYYESKRSCSTFLNRAFVHEEVLKTLKNELIELFNIKG